MGPMELMVNSPRMSWFIGQILTTLRYRHMKTTCMERLHSAFAAQLETVYLWHLRIIVLLHLEAGTRRKAAVWHVALDGEVEGN